MGIRKALLPYIPSPILQMYRKRKRDSISQNKKYEKTGNNVLIKQIQLSETIIRHKKVDTVCVIRYLAWENPFDWYDYRKYQYQENLYKLDKKAAISVEFTNYGIWTVEVTYYRGKKDVAKEVQTINIEAPEYNIVYLAATLPVVFFLMEMWKKYKSEIPSIVMLERILFNYEKLPDYFFPFPLAKESELNTAYCGFEQCAQRLVSYIGMLFKMNSMSKFNLYLCDHQAYYVLSLLYANKIPESNFSVHLLSDGTGSYDCFTFAFNTENAEILYTDMCKTWRLAKQNAQDTGVQKWGEESFIHCGNPSVSEGISSNNLIEHLSNRFAYSYVMTNENSNFELILHDVKFLKGNNKVLRYMTNRVHNIDFFTSKKQLLKHKEELIKLMDMGDNPFKNSVISCKKICVLLGTFPLKDNEEKYIDKMLEFFGKEYDFYLKDHPWATDNEIRNESFINKGIVLLDSKVPTEIYMMLYPMIFIAGYISSTFLSINLLNNPKEQIIAVWDVTDRKIQTNCLDFSAKYAMNFENNNVVVYK